MLCRATRWLDIAAAGLCGLADAAGAQALPRHGGMGGGDFMLECGPGTVLTRLRGTWGQGAVGLVSLSSMSAVCTAIDDEGHLLDQDFSAEPYRGVGGGGGDETGEAICEGVAVGLRGGVNRRDEIESSGLICGRLAAGKATLLDEVPDPNSGSGFADVCDPGSALFAIRGRAGERIDAVQGLCAPPLGPRPKLLPWRGANGGGYYRLECPPGQVITSLEGSYSEFVFGIRIVCNARASDGTLSGGPWTSSRTGGGGGVALQQACDAGMAGVGLSGRSGRYMDALGLVCASSKKLDDPSAKFAEGGPGGGAFQDVCAPGHALTGIVGNSAYIDAVSGVCSEAPYRPAWWRGLVFWR